MNHDDDDEQLMSIVSFNQWMNWIELNWYVNISLHIFIVLILYYISISIHLKFVYTQIFISFFIFLYSFKYMLITKQLNNNY